MNRLTGLLFDMSIRILILQIAVCLTVSLLAVGCSAQTEEQALENLRTLTRDGQLPPENVAADLEKRFAGKRTGALARLVHARIRYEAGDYAGAAALLNTDVFRTKTRVADEALWLKGRSLLFARDANGAAAAFKELVESYPSSIRSHDALIGWATADLANPQPKTEQILANLLANGDPEALIVVARGAEGKGDTQKAATYYRLAYFSPLALAQDPKTHLIADPAAEAAGKVQSFLGQSLAPQNPQEASAAATRLMKAGKYAEAGAILDTAASNFPAGLTSAVQLQRVSAYANSARLSDAAAALNSIPANAKEKEDAYRLLALGYAKARQWQQARTTVEEMRAKFPSGTLIAKTMMDVGLAARDAKNNVDAAYFFNTAVSSYPNAVEVAQAQFESAWLQHESRNFVLSSQMMIDHLARYADKDTSNRGKAGYWSARDSERAGKTAEACALYDGTIYRYGSNWYGYLAAQRIAAMRAAGQCSSTTPPNATVAKAVANLRTVTVAAETAGPREKDLVAKADELSIVGMFDWAIEQLNDAKRTAGNSPSVNLALARYYRIRKAKNDYTNAFVALAKTYPDYAQMFPEEMTPEEWNIFYPLTNWADIKYWSAQRNLDPYQVAGLIRQESVFDPKAASGANAYGLMQLLVPTAQTTARKYVSKIGQVTSTSLLQPAVSIELGTAYLRDQLDKFGRIEYVAVAYNAGPGRVPQWRATLPAEIDEFVEAIPFKETKQYVQGVVRNAAQYRRLYDENGNFRSNVGSRPLRGVIDEEPRDQFTAENPDVNVDDAVGE